MISKEKQEILKNSWNQAEKVRKYLTFGEWDFQRCFLSFLFYRFISESMLERVNSEGGWFENNYLELKDDDEDVVCMKEDLTSAQGYFIYPSQLFSNVLKNEDTRDLNNYLLNIAEEIENSPDNSNAKSCFKGLLENLNVSRSNWSVAQQIRGIREVMQTVQNLNGECHEENILGEIYKYLIKEYATAMKQDGEKFFTPTELSDLLVEIVASTPRNRKIIKVYDPACGYGSLFFKFKTKLKHSEDLIFYGQEIDEDVHKLCRMNLLINKITYEKFHIAIGNTLEDDKFEDLKFDAIVSNPPFTCKWSEDTYQNFHNDPRFSELGGMTNKGEAYWAFIQHSVYHLSEEGSAAILCSSGALSRGNKVETQIKEVLVQNNLLDAIIKLPPKLFVSGGIEASIIVLRKSKFEKDFLFIDASEFCEKDKKRNKLSEENISEIMRLFRERKDEKYKSKVVSYKEIEERKYDLAVNKYVETKDEKEIINIFELERSLAERTARINILRKEIDELASKIKEEFSIKEET